MRKASTDPRPRKEQTIQSQSKQSQKARGQRINNFGNTERRFPHTIPNQDKGFGWGETIISLFLT